MDIQSSIGYMVVFLTWGYPKKDCLYIMRNPTKMDDSGVALL